MAVLFSFVGFDVGDWAKHNRSMLTRARESLIGLIGTWPRRTLAVVLVIHLLLAIRQLVWRVGFPPRTNHFGFKNVLELRRLFEGYVPTWPLVHPGRTTHYYPQVEPVDWFSPMVFLQEMGAGKLRPLFQNHGDVIYWVEIPHPFFLATVWGAITDWTLWAIPLVFTGYFLLLLVSLFGIASAVSDEWTGVSVAAVGGGFPVLFGFGRFIHDTLPIASLCTFMVWMALSSNGFRRWSRCVAFGLAGWSMLRSGESFYGSVLGMLVILGPVLFEVGHAIVDGMDRRGWVGLALVVGIPVLTFDWWWLSPALDYLGDEDPFGDIMMAPRIAHWVDASWREPLIHGAYFVTMVNDLVRPWMMIWVGLGVLFYWRSDARRKWGLALMFVVPFACLCWMTRKSNWYIVPVAPGLALVGVLGLRGLPGKLGMRAVAVAGVAGIISALFYGLAPDHIRRSIPQWADRPYRGLVVMREVELAPFKMYAGRAIISGAEEVVRTLDRTQAVDGEQRQLALFCEDQFWAWAFKYVVEMRRPDVHVVSLIHINLLEHYAAELDASEFDYLVMLGDHGVESWQPEVSTGLPTGMKAPTNEGAFHFRRFMQGLSKREYQRIPMARGGVYTLE
jgi:hypothetical protein